ncbi:protein N-acetylglucosaminyltransferase [Aureococcus anophagefferens]|nr:protein N-acetylglucosaminyltransferase [Aureococcus anophagefferens]
MATFARASSPTPGGALLKRAPYLETEEQAAQQPHRTYYYRQNHGEAGCEASIARCTAELASASGEVARALRRERAGYHARAGSYDAALADYSAALELSVGDLDRDGASAGLHQARGEVLEKVGRTGEAIDDFTRYSACLELSPKHFRARFDRAFALDALGDLPRAVLDYTAAIAIDASTRSWYNRGIARRLRDAEAAVLDFTKAIEHALAREAGAAKQGAAAKDRFPVADFYHNRAFCKRKLADFSGAVGDYWRRAKDPKHFKALYNRAFCLDALGRRAEALKDYEAALALPAHASAHHNRVRLDDAAESFDRAVAIRPDDAKYHHARGANARHRGLHAKANKCFSVPKPTTGLGGPDQT